jgi:hypothetical protein
MVLAVTALFLAAASYHLSAIGAGKNSVMTPQVNVLADGTITVMPDPLVFNTGLRKVNIRWQVPKTSNLTFPDNGIVIDGEVVAGPAPGGTGPQARIEANQDEVAQCKVSADRKEFTCHNKHSRPGHFKYTIRLDQAGKPLKALDPTLMNG